MRILTTDPTDTWPAGRTGSALVLRFDRTPAERAVLDRWMSDNLPKGVVAECFSVGDLDWHRRVAEQPDDMMIVPIRIAWSAPTQMGTSRWTDALAALNARKPLAAVQKRILHDNPERCTVICAEPGSVRDLRSRFHSTTSGDGSFEAFIGRQAELALERAERAIGSGRYKVPRLVSEEIRSSRSFVTGAKMLAQQTGHRVDEIARTAEGYLDEMAAAHSRLAIDLFERFGRFLMRAYEVGVDPERLEALVDLNRTHSLVFLPNHRSYLDPFVVRSMLLANRFPANHCFAGNNMAWWPMGDWTRRTGNIILRRSIGDDPVYKFVLREYLGYLTTKRLNLEWYIEGGRTRTGKLRPPRFGLLTYLIDAFDQLGDTGRDVYLVPMSIVYDGLPEVVSLTAEQRGAAKKPESIAWLLQYPRATGKGFGKVHVCIGEPLSLRTALGIGEDESKRHRVEKVAFEVCHRINRATPITATALVTLALLGVDDRALTLTEIEVVVDPFVAYFAQRSLPITADLTRRGELRHTLDWLSDNGVVVRFAEGSEPVWGISPDRHLEAAFYRNSIVHHLLDRAIVELVLAAAADGAISLESEAWGEASRLRDLLKFEFFFPDKEEYRNNLKSELSFIAPDWRDHISDPEYSKRILAEARPHLAHRALHSFVETYFVTADRLAVRSPSRSIDEDGFISECVGIARQRRMQQRLRSSDSTSTEVFSSSLKLAAHRDLLGPGGKELVGRRRLFAAELAELLARIQAMRALAASEVESRYL